MNKQKKYLSWDYVAQLARHRRSRRMGEREMSIDHSENQNEFEVWSRGGQRLCLLYAKSVWWIGCFTAGCLHSSFSACVAVVLAQLRKYKVSAFEISVKLARLFVLSNFEIRDRRLINVVEISMRSLHTLRSMCVCVWQKASCKAFVSMSKMLNISLSCSRITWNKLISWTNWCIFSSSLPLRAAALRAVFYK